MSRILYLVLIFALVSVHSVHLTQNRAQTQSEYIYIYIYLYIYIYIFSHLHQIQKYIYIGVKRLNMFCTNIFVNALQIVTSSDFRPPICATILANNLVTNILHLEEQVIHSNALKVIPIIANVIAKPKKKIAKRITIVTITYTRYLMRSNLSIYILYIYIYILYIGNLFHLHHRLLQLRWNQNQLSNLFIYIYICHSQLVAAVANGLPVKYSSVYNHVNCNTSTNFKLNSVQDVGWCAAKSNPGEWVQIDAPDEVFWKKIETKGRWKQFVKTYKLKYSNDGTTWKDYQGTFTGNSDSKSSKVNLIEPPIKAKMLRILPLTFYNHMSMKFEAYYKEY